MSRRWPAAAAERARELEDRSGEALARVVAAEARLNFGRRPDVDELERRCREALPLLEQAGDHLGQARVWYALGIGVSNYAGRWRSGRRQPCGQSSSSRLAGRQPMGLGGFRPRCSSGRALRTRRCGCSMRSRARTSCMLRGAAGAGGLLAMLGRFDEAWALALPAAERARELDGDDCGRASRSARSPRSRETTERRRIGSAARAGAWEARGSRRAALEFRAKLGRSLCALGRYEEAEPLAEQGRELGDERDYVTQMYWRQVKALVLAHRGEHAEAEQLARESVQVTEATDGLNDQAEALLRPGRVLAAAGRSDEAARGARAGARALRAQEEPGHGRAGATEAGGAPCPRVLAAATRTASAPGSARSAARPRGRPSPREQRKTVTVLFCDVTGSTALGESTDPEALRALLARYFERMKGIVESHGGTVEKFIGDAVMAVFGVPQVHEDDALRACRAAVEMRDALPELGVAGPHRRQHRRGRDRNRGAPRDRRRRQRRRAPRAGGAAGRDPDRRRRRSRSSATRSRAEPVEPLELKGKAEPVAAYRLLAVPRDAGARARRAASSGASASCERSCRRPGSARRQRAVLPARHCGRRRRRGQVAPRVRVPRRLDGAGRPRPLPLLRRGHHVLAGGRGAQAAGRAALRSGRGGLAPLAAGRDGEATLAEEIAWAFRKLLEERAPLVVRLRRHPVGRGDVPRSGRARRRPLPGRAAPAPLHGPARIERAPARQWPVTVRLEPLPTEDVDALIPEHARRRAARADRARSRRKPAVRPGDGCDGARDGRRGRGSAQPQGLARRTPRPARDGRARGLGARRGRRGGLPPRLRPGAPPEKTGDAAPRRARPQGARPPGSPQAPGRGRLPLPPSPDPRRGLRRASEGDPGRAARAVRRTGSRSTAANWSSWTKSSATTSSRPAGTAASSARLRTLF